MYNIFSNYLDKQGWKYQWLSETNKLFFGIRSSFGKFSCLLHIDQLQERSIFFSIFPTNVPEKDKNLVASLLSRINCVLFDGCFLIDFSDGEIRFRTSLIHSPHSENVLPEQNIEHFIKGNISTMNAYFRVLEDITSGKISENDAISQIASIK